MLKLIKRAFATIKSWYVKDENGHVNRPASTIFMACLTLPFVVYEGVKIGLFDKYRAGHNIGLETLVEGFNTPLVEVLEMGKRLPFGNKAWAPHYLVVLLLIWASIFVFMYIAADRNRNKSLNKDGDMKFGKIDEYNKELAYPLGKEGFEEPEEPTADTPGNMITSERSRYNLSGSAYTYSCAFVVGSTGSAKTYRYVKPNIMQMNSSYIITDPKGELLRDTGKMLADNGYDVLVFNLKKGEQAFSCRYNPFNYIHSEQDVILAVDAFLDATAGKNLGGDAFFPIAEKNFYYALFYWVFTMLPPEERTLKAVYELYSSANEQEVQKGKAPVETDFDRKFFKAFEDDPYNPCLSFYNTFKQGSPKTKQSILISVGIKMWFLSVPETANLLSGDDLHFNTLAERKTALFVCIPTDSDSFKCLSAMLFSQLFQELYYQGETLNARTYLLKKGNWTAGRSSQFVEGIGEDKAYAELEERQRHFQSAQIYYEGDLAKQDKELKARLETPIEEKIGITPYPMYIVANSLDKEKANIYERFRSRAAAEAYLDAGRNGKIVQVSGLAVRTRFILDEFYAIGKIQGFESKIATFRSLKISADIICQNLEQLKEMYEDKEGKITGNCDLKICLGVNTYNDAKAFSDMCGQGTVKSESTSLKNDGFAPMATGGTLSDNAQMLVRPEWLLNQMKGDMCLILTRTMLPIKDKKYNTPQHPMWKYTYNDRDKATAGNRYPFRRIYYIEQKKEACIKTILTPMSVAKAVQNIQGPEHTEPEKESLKVLSDKRRAVNITNRDQIKQQMLNLHNRIVKDADEDEKKLTLIVNDDGTVPVKCFSESEKSRMYKALKAGTIKNSDKNSVPAEMPPTTLDLGDALSVFTDTDDLY